MDKQILIVSKKEGPHGLLLVITDKEILGSRFEERNKQLDLSKEFYQGEEMSVDKVKELIPKGRDLHLTGKHSVGLGVELDLVNPKSIFYVQKIPHAQVVMFG